MDRLAEDHDSAGRIADALRKKGFVHGIMPVETNIVIIDVDPVIPAKTLAQELREKDILTIAISPTQVRFVTHLDVTPEMVDRTVAAIEQL